MSSNANNAYDQLGQRRATALIVASASVQVFWGLLFSIQPPFYSSEAEKKGATPAQYGFVFGIIHLAAFIAAPIFGRFGPKLGPKRVYNIGGFSQGAIGIVFGFLHYVDNIGAFLGLSYLLRFLDGVADAASWSALVAILIDIWPDRAAQIISWGESAYGLGYTIGPAIGSGLYIAGGFKLPFFVVGSLGIVISLSLYFLLPKRERNVQNTDHQEADRSQNQPFSLQTIFTVSTRISNGDTKFLFCMF